MKLYQSSSLAFLSIFMFSAGCAQDTSQGWKEIVSPENKFKVKMPGDAKKESKKTPDGRDIISWEVADGKITTGGEFGMNVGASKVKDADVSKSVLDSARDSIVKGFGAKLRSESDFKRQGKVIGRQMDVEIPDLGLKGKIVYAIANGKAYQLNVMGQPTWEGLTKADQFFDSFELVP